MKVAVGYVLEGGKIYLLKDDVIALLREYITMAPGDETDALLTTICRDIESYE